MNVGRRPGSGGRRTPRAQPLENAGAVKGSVDLLAAAVLAFLAAFAVALIPSGGAFRIALVAPVLLVVPGYLLIELSQGPRTRVRSRLAHALLALGLSPPIVGLLALSTALVPGGFRPELIVGATTGACLLMALAAHHRRTRALVVAAASPKGTPDGAGFAGIPEAPPPVGAPPERHDEPAARWGGPAEGLSAEPANRP